MQPGTLAGDDVGSPVPSVSRFHHHLRRLSSAAQHRSQPLSIVENPDRLQYLTALSHPHDHTATAVKTSTHKLPPCVRFHRGPPSS
jgi:hypothetical protein